MDRRLAQESLSRYPTPYPATREVPFVGPDCLTSLRPGWRVLAVLYFQACGAGQDHARIPFPENCKVRS